MSRAAEVSGLHSAVCLGMYKAHADSTGVELVVVDLLLFVSCGCWYTNHRYVRRHRVTTNSLTDTVHKIAMSSEWETGICGCCDVKDCGVGCCVMLYCVRPRVPRIMHHKPACRDRVLALRLPLHSRFQPPALCLVLTVCYVCYHVLTGRMLHLGRRHGEGRSRLLLRLLPGPLLLSPMHPLPGVRDEMG